MRIENQAILACQVVRETRSAKACQALLEIQERIACQVQSETQIWLACQKIGETQLTAACQCYEEIRNQLAFFFKEKTVHHNPIRPYVKGAYAMQKLRIEMGNRIVANFKIKLGQEPGKNEDTLDDESKELLASIRKKCSRVADAVVDGKDKPKKRFADDPAAGDVMKLLLRHYKTVAIDGELPKKAKFKADPVFSEYTEAALVASYVDMLAYEQKHFHILGKIVSDHPIWKAFLDDVRGVGPAMGGVIIAEFNIHKSKYVSSMWAYAGLDVGSDGRARSKRKEHLVDREYMKPNGELGTKKSITYNPFLHDKLLGVLADCLIKSSRKAGRYYGAYADTKHRLENHPKYKKGVTNGFHRERYAKRKMIKLFIQDLYVAWKEVEGLPAMPPYSVAKLGMDHAA